MAISNSAENALLKSWNSVGFLIFPAFKSWLLNRIMFYLILNLCLAGLFSTSVRAYYNSFYSSDFIEELSSSYISWLSTMPSSSYSGYWTLVGLRLLPKVLVTLQNFIMPEIKDSIYSGVAFYSGLMAIFIIYFFKDVKNSWASVFC